MKTIRVNDETRERLTQAKRELAARKLKDVTMDEIVSKMIDLYQRDARKASGETDERAYELKKSVCNVSVRARSDDELRMLSDDANARIEQVRGRVGPYRETRFYYALRAWENLTADELVRLSVTLSLSTQESFVLDLLINQKYLEDELRRRGLQQTLPQTAE